MVFEKHINKIEEKIGYSFKDKSLLRQAFTRSSYANEHTGSRGVKYQSNEVLEFFGDSVLSAAIVTLLMRDYSKRYEYGISTDFKEGDFSNIKSRLSDKKNLSVATHRMELQRFLLLGEGDEKIGVQTEPSVMEDLFESIIGAVYIDSGNDILAVIETVSKMLDISEYAAISAPPIQSAKNALQEWCADKKHRLPAPIYKTVAETGPDHKKLYERACYIGNKVYGTGHGKNQKLADAAAAEEALKAICAEYERERAATIEADTAQSLQKLKEYAAKNKKTSPEFRDLGESQYSTPSRREYVIECRFAGISATEAAESKKEAKAKAADKILKELTRLPSKSQKIGKKSAAATKKTAPQKKAPTPKKTVKKSAPKAAKK